jgi:hypothetical protein
VAEFLRESRERLETLLIFLSRPTEWLFCANNKFSGSIPSEIGLLANVEYFFFERNALSGTIPTEVGLLSELRELDLYDNLLSGRVPEEIFAGMAPWLQSIDLANCLLTGTISTQIGLLQTCEVFIVDGNKLTGTIPTETGMMEDIQKFHVNANWLNGTIPTELCQLRNAQGLTSLKADCSPLSSTFEIPMFCPSGCCDECCNQETDICLAA